MLKTWVVLLCLLAAAASAQEWEIGAIGGFGFAKSNDAKSSAGSASAGFRNGATLGAFGGGDTHRYWGGEVRYLYRYSDLKLSSGSTDVRFDGHTHIVEANFMGHFRPREARMRPFIAFGGGAKIIQGTGVERANQPLGRIAALTATQEILGVVGVGGGIKMNLSNHFRLRLEGRDYISGFPKNIIAPAPGGSVGGVLHDVLGLAAISYTW